MKKILLLSLALIFFGLQYSTASAINCGVYSYESCGDFTSQACGGSTSCYVTDMGNGSCYNTCTCATITLQGSSFSGWTTGTWPNGQEFCSPMYSGPSCQVSGNSGGTLSSPSYSCGGGGGGSPTTPGTTPGTTFFDLTVTPSTASISNGQTTSYTLIVNPSINSGTGLADVRAVGTYTLPTPIPGCPTGATCTYVGNNNTITVNQDTTSGGVDFAVAGSRGVLVNASTVTPNTYSLTFTAVNDKNQTQSATANLIISPTLPVVTISVSPTSATAPGATTVTWSVANSPTSCTASGGYGSTWSGSKAASGSLVVSGYPNGSYTLSLSCTNASGTSSNSAVFTVSATPPPVVDMKGWGNAVPQGSPTDGPIAMTVGGVGGLVWSSSNATNCQIFRDGTLVGNFATNGNAGVGPMSVTNNHTITCTGPGGTSNTDSVIHTVPAPTNNASCTSISAPATVSIGQTFNTTVTMQNSGGTTWTPSGANNYHLLISPWSATPWSNARVMVGSTVAPGASYAFTLPITAPSTPGTYTIGTQMIQEGVEWFGAICNGGSITVNPLTPTVSLSASPTTGASPLTTTLSWSTTNTPSSCTAGGGWSGSKTPSGGSQVISGITTGTTYTLVCTNAGGTSTTASVTVTPIGAISVAISAAPASMTLPTNATRLTWTTTGNPTSCTASNYWSGSKTASGGFEDRTGMTAGSYVFVITCSKAGVPDTSASVTVPVAAAALVNNSSCNSITAPSSVVAGQTFTGTIVMQNNGTKPWTNIYTSASDQEHKLGSWNPASNATWGVTRMLLPGGASIAPGSAATFTGTFTAPSTPGNYAFDFAMLEEAVEWFGTPCAKSGGITVTAPATTGTLSPATPSCTIASGASSCTVNLTWTTTNPVGTSAITATGMTNVNGNSGTNIAFTVPYNSRTFYLYNNAILLATSNATASCVAGTSWDGSICTSGPITSCPSGTAYIASKTLSTTRNDLSAWVGAKITIGSSPRSVSALGRIRVAGNSASHVVKIVKDSDGLDLPGGSVSIDMSTGTADQYKYANLAAPVTLSANTSYYIVSQEVNGGDFWYRANGLSTIPTSAGTVDGPLYWNGSGWSLNPGQPNQMYVPIDLCSTVYTAPPSSNKIIGKVCKDDNADGVCNNGEIYIRDTSIGACTNPSSAQSNFSANFVGPQSGSRLLNACSGSTGDPIYDISSLADGSYSVSLTMPSGWAYTGCTVNVSTNCALPSAGTVSVSGGSTGVVLFTARPPLAVTQYTLTVTKTIGGAVTTTDGNISCGASCTKAYDQGTVVTLQAVPDTVQWKFAGWSGACTGTGNCALTIDGNKTVTAQFKPRALLYQEF